MNGLNPSQLSAASSLEPGHPAASLLVVEDDPQISDLYQIILERAGYRVSLAGDGLEALELFRAAQREGRSYDLVLMDLSLPRMDGLECLRHLTGIDQGIRVLISSGSPSVDFQDLAPWVAGVVQKPVRMATLLAQIGQLLDQRPSPDPA